MSLTEEIKGELGPLWIPQIYRERVRTQRTRAFDLAVPPKENDVEIVHTLLGIQLKTGKKLIGCPDLSTARYLRVFARIGCDDVAIPYDITKLSALADEFDSAWHKMLLLLDAKTRGGSAQIRGRHRASLIRSMKTEIVQAGAGEIMPAFDTETKQRKN